MYVKCVALAGKGEGGQFSPTFRPGPVCRYIHDISRYSKLPHRGFILRL